MFPVPLLGVPGGMTAPFGGTTPFGTSGHTGGMPSPFAGGMPPMMGAHHHMMGGPGPMPGAHPGGGCLGMHAPMGMPPSMPGGAPNAARRKGGGANGGKGGGGSGGKGGGKGGGGGKGRGGAGGNFGSGGRGLGVGLGAGAGGGFRAGGGGRGDGGGRGAAAAGGCGGKGGAGGGGGGTKSFDVAGCAGGAGAVLAPVPAGGEPAGGWGRVPTVPADFVIDTDKRFGGTVTFFSKLKGYGFVELTEKGVVPENRLFVQWRSIKSADRFPFLMKDMEVEFQIAKWQGAAGKDQVSLRAMDVSLPGGSAVLLQDRVDAEKKAFIGGQEMRYFGILKFYNPRYGYGYITVDPKFVTEDGASAVPSELRVERSEVNAGGQNPGAMQDVEVEFGIWKTSRDVPKAYNVTLPGGAPLALEALEHRQGVGPQMYRGEVNLWNWQSGWGFIKPEPTVPLPLAVQAKLTKQTQDAKKRAEERGRTGSDEELLYVRRDDVVPGVRLLKGMQVMFQLYVDDKGVGATQVQAI